MRFISDVRRMNMKVSAAIGELVRSNKNNTAQRRSPFDITPNTTIILNPVGGVCFLVVRTPP